jgi:4a-hydroxytetrahydrobiopterin dehydratase
MSAAQCQEAIAKLPGWSLATPAASEAASMTKTYQFRDFHAAWGFMSGCTPFINASDHHPEWFNVYGTVRVKLTTHDCDGVSEKDMALAREMERVAAMCASK